MLGRATVPGGPFRAL
ncbi:unnamed protein product, partial [Rotaria magnacalcarata]